VSVKASQALHSNNAGQDAPAPSKVNQANTVIHIRVYLQY
jgi:hypothetical protein